MKWKEDLPRQAWPQLLALAKAGSAAAPGNAAIWIGLAQSALGLGEEAAAVEPLLDAVSRIRASAPLHAIAARLLFALDRFDEARVQVDAALRLDPSDRGARMLDFMLLVKTGRWHQAAERIEDIAAINRLEPQLLEVRWRTARGGEDLLALLALCDDILGEQPRHANARYFRAFLLAALGRDEEARQAMPTDALAEIVDLPAPDGFADGDAFRAALREEILANPTLIWNPRTKSTREGARTRRLRQPGAHAVEALVGQIRSAVADRAERLAGEAPETVRLDIWASVLGRNGFLMSHRHPNGWLSGTYYVCAPEAPDGTHGGPLLFGALDPQRDGITPPWLVRRIDPVPGRLILFPSYVPHATEASRIQGERISVAFDVIPASPT